MLCSLSLCFLTYFKDFADNLASNPKFFADNTSLFSVVRNMCTPSLELNNDLTKISNWKFKLKMNFNTDPTKQAQEVIFSRKTQTQKYSVIYFNKNLVM